MTFPFTSALLCNVSAQRDRQRHTNERIESCCSILFDNRFFLSLVVAATTHQSIATIDDTSGRGRGRGTATWSDHVGCFPLTLLDLLAERFKRSLGAGGRQRLSCGGGSCDWQRPSRHNWVNRRPSKNPRDGFDGRTCKRRNRRRNGFDGRTCKRHN